MSDEKRPFEENEIQDTELDTVSGGGGVDPSGTGGNSPEQGGGIGPDTKMMQPK